MSALIISICLLCPMHALANQPMGNELFSDVSEADWFYSYLKNVSEKNFVDFVSEDICKPKKNLVFSAYLDEEHGGSRDTMAAVMKYPSERIVNMDGRQNQIWHYAPVVQEVSYRFHTNQTAVSAEITARAFSVVLDVMKDFAEKRRNIGK